MVEIPADNPVQLALPIFAALNGGPSDVDRRISVQLLLAEYRQESGQE